MGVTVTVRSCRYLRSTRTSFSTYFRENRRFYGVFAEIQVFSPTWTRKRDDVTAVSPTIVVTVVLLLKCQIYFRIRT